MHGYFLNDRSLAWLVIKTHRFNTLRPVPNACHIVDDISNAFSWNKSFVFWSKFHGILYTRMDYVLGNGSAPSRQHAIIWTNNQPVYWCIYAPSDLNVLILKEIHIIYNSGTKLMVGWSLSLNCYLFCVDVVHIRLFKKRKRVFPYDDQEIIIRLLKIFWIAHEASVIQFFHSLLEAFMRAIIWHPLCRLE